MNLCLFLMSKFSIAVIVMFMVVFLLLVTTFMTWGSHRLNSAIAKFEAWLPQWVSESGWQLVEYTNETGPGSNSWLPRRDSLYLRFVIRDHQKNEYVGWASYNINLIGSGQINVRWETSEPPHNRENPISLG
jgi:hypothetical protein